MNWSLLTDIHTHQPGRPEALLSLEPEQALAGCDTPYSLSLHPWHISQPWDKTQAQWHEAVALSQHDPLWMAVGECGLDNHCSTPLPLQLEAFRLSLHTAVEHRKPVIIHCVGYWAEMLQCVRQSGLPLGAERFAQGTGGALVHGFRKGPQLAQQLLDAGFCLSLGAHYNPATRAIIPADRLYSETD